MTTKTPTSYRARQWRTFAKAVEDHVETYTVPQYGDYPDDQVTDFTEDDIICNIQRYVSRMKSNARGYDESLRDLKKLAHYCCLLHAIRVSKAIPVEPDSSTHRIPRRSHAPHRRHK